MTALLLALLAPALAAPAPSCDAKALERAVMQASPSTEADAFPALAKCDATRAKKAAGTYMRNMVADATALPAVLEALRIGADEDILAWIGDETPDVRSRMVAKLGGLCKDNPDLVASFFAKAQGRMGDQFVEERWHRGLDDCRTGGVQQLLTSMVEAEKGRTRNDMRFFSVLEVWARNLGAAAVPRLKEWTAAAETEEQATLFVNAFADAARVGSLEGTDAEAAKLAGAAIVELAPTLPYRAVLRARDTLNSLGMPEEASKVAKHAWRDRYEDGHYTYAVTLVEDATCKNGKRRGALHLGTFVEPGDQWPDQLAPTVEERLKQEFAPSVAEKCKGTGTITVKVSDAPTTAEERAAWEQEARKAFAEQMKGAQKVEESVHSAFTW